MTKKQIRLRDRRMWEKENGPFPEGMQIHHLWYSDEYDNNSFVICTPEEHAKYHNVASIPSPSSGVSLKEMKRKHDKKYYESHKEEHMEYNKRKREENPEWYKEYMKKYYEEHKEEFKRRSHENYLKRKHRERLIELGVI